MAKSILGMSGDQTTPPLNPAIITEEKASEAIESAPVPESMSEKTSDKSDDFGKDDSCESRSLDSQNESKEGVHRPSKESPDIMTAQESSVHETKTSLDLVFSDDEISLNEDFSDLQSEGTKASNPVDGEMTITSKSDSVSSPDPSSDSEVSSIQLFSDENDEEEDTVDGPILSKNELSDERAPCLPVNYKISENLPLEYVGDVTTLVERNVIIKANVSGEFRVLKENSVLCFEDRLVLGLLFETFGRLQSPNYRVRFNTDEDFAKVKDRNGAKVYYVVPDSQFVYTDALKKLKGTDASNCHDEEVPEDEQEFSDDECELAAKQEKKRKRKQKKNDGNERTQKKSQQLSQDQNFVSYGFADRNHSIVGTQIQNGYQSYNGAGENTGFGHQIPLLSDRYYPTLGYQAQQNPYPVPQNWNQGYNGYQNPQTQAHEMTQMQGNWAFGHNMMQHPPSYSNWSHNSAYLPTQPQHQQQYQQYQQSPHSQPPNERVESQIPLTVLRQLQQMIATQAPSARDGNDVNSHK